MMAAWLLCFIAVGMLLLLAALAADVVCARIGFPRRAPWTVAMLAMAVLPLVLRQITPPLSSLDSQISARSVAGSPPTPTVRLSEAASAGGQAIASSAPSRDRMAPSSVAPRLQVADDSLWNEFDRIAVVTWGALSLACGLLLIAAHRRIQRTRHDWTRAPEPLERQVEDLTGTPTQLWCSTDIGPAAFGVRSPAIVIPNWALEIDDDARTLLLTHEASHITAHDPLLLRVALAAVVVMPWNLPMLIAYRRLHRAVEHDCDARVLGATRDARRYGRLLLATAERLGRTGDTTAWARSARWLPAPMAGIGMRPSELELRLRALVRPAATWATRLQSLSATTVLLVASLLACSVPAPERVATLGGQRDDDDGGAFRVISRARQSNGSSVPTAIDSIAAMEAFMANVMPRARVLQDSIISAAARRAEPHVFNGSAPDVEDVWLLLNDDYTVRRSNTGRQYYSVARRDTPGSGTPNRVAASPDTPRQQLILGVEAFVRAFPGITAQNVAGLWSSMDVITAQRTVNVLWARYIPTPTVSGAPEDTFTTLDLVGRSTRSRTFSDAQRQRASTQLDRLMREAMQRHWQRVFVETPDQYPVLWVLFDSGGREITSGTGRDGLFALGADGKVPKPTSANPARPWTPPSQLGIDCDAFEAKFPTVEAARKTPSCGMGRFPIPGSDRAVVVVFGISQAD